MDRGSTQHLGQLIPEQCMGGPREQDLAAMASRQEAAGTVERRAKVVVLALLGCPGVERYPDPDRPGLAPGLGLQRALGSEGRGKRLGWGGKGGAEGIAGPLEDLPMMRVDELAEDGVVALLGSLHRLKVLLPMDTTPLAVREKEGAGRQVSHSCGTPGVLA